MLEVVQNENTCLQENLILFCRGHSIYPLLPIFSELSHCHRSTDLVQLRGGSPFKDEVGK